MESKILNIENLRAEISGILPSFGSFMADCAIFALSTNGNRSGTFMQVLREKVKLEDVELIWKTILGFDAARTMQDENRTVEFGAMGLAILLSIALTEYKHFVVARKHHGIDFWLYEQEPQSLDFGAADARLEISGILRETEKNQLSYRFHQKKKQATGHEVNELPTYISVTEFQTPTTYFVRV